MNRRKIFSFLITICTLFFCTSTINAASSDKLMKKVESMSLRDRIAQLYFVPSSGDPNQMRNDIQKYHLGGVLLFGSDFQNESKQQFKDKLNSFQKVSPIPLFIGTDQEGGSVSRLSDNPQLADQRQFHAPIELNQNLTQEANEASDTAKILHDLGINWNFAPVADVSVDPQSFIYPRTFGKDYKQTATYIQKVVPAIQKQKVVATLKHFPGYGTASDTHTGLAATDKSLSDLKKQDFLPFKAGIKAHVDAVLVSHIIIKNVDNYYPASLSPKIISILRNDLKIKGLIVTDDLGMGAITQFADEHHINPDVQAIKAGNDLILSKNYATGIPAIETAVKNHEISEKQINRSVYRILKVKQQIQAQ